MSFFFMLPQKFYFVTTFSQDLNWKKRLFFFFLLRTYTKFITTKKKHNVKTMQPLTTLYKNTRHFTKKNSQIFFIILWINKKRFTFVEKLLDLDWRKNKITRTKIYVFYFKVDPFTPLWYNSLLTTSLLSFEDQRA